MIPLALTLKGFLSFRDEQRLAFEQDQVWLLTGPNGSGKSAVFDAILFALYAGHRAGKADLHELINKDADRAVVRFEFLLDGRRYRAERLAERTTDRKTGRAGYSSTQQLYAWENGDVGSWQPIAGTSRQGDFQEWVRDHVGLSFDAFTSSALLMQGRAEVLVAQDAEAARRRFEVLARIVGLDYYERLFKQADELRKKNQKRADELQAQLAVIEPIDAARLDALAQQSVEVAAALARAEEQLDRLHGQKLIAAKWVELGAQRAAKQHEWDGASRLLGDAAAIERDGQRWQDLHILLPGLERLLEQRRQVADAETAAAALQRDRTQPVGQVTDADARLNRCRAEIARLEEARTQDDARRQELNAIEHRLHLAQGPLRRLFRQRQELLRAQTAAVNAGPQLAEAESGVRRCEAELAPLAVALQAAMQTQRDASHEATRARTRLSEFEDQSRRFAEVAAEQRCSYCGQELSAEHAAREQARIARELAARKALWELARTALATAVQDEKRCQAAHQAADRALSAARTEAEARRRQRELAAEQARVLTPGVQEAYAELPESHRCRVSPAPPTDWTATVYPRVADLAAIDDELAQVATQLRGLQKAAAERQESGRQLRKQQQQAERDQGALQQKLSAIDRAIAQQTERVKLGRQQLEPLVAALPAAWQERAAELDATQVQALAAEHSQLTICGAEPKLRQLRVAQAAQEPLRRQLEQLDAELLQVPAECCCDPNELEPALRVAKQHENELRKEQSTLDAERRQLELVRERRDRIDAEHRAADRARHLSSRLAELLSRRHLQRHLLRQAEVGIVANTNHVLDRITAGQLIVRLLPEEGNDENRALQLEGYRPAAGQSYGLSFLSGSERFRVAIGLALGIGQYASRQHRAIESVIIDEGFGCLDRDNRRTMIDELDHLRGQLRCILLVSHQEEFADAFPEGYRFRFSEGTSHVDRSE
jgi:DNA repair exonuclease SbcCD ATPase subunit